MSDSAERACFSAQIPGRVFAKIAGSEEKKLLHESRALSRVQSAEMWGFFLAILWFLSGVDIKYLLQIQRRADMLHSPICIIASGHVYLECVTGCSTHHVRQSS